MQSSCSTPPIPWFLSRRFLVGAALVFLLPVAGCSRPDASDGEDVDSFGQALAPESCNGVDDDGNFLIDDANACTFTRQSFGDHAYLFLDSAVDQATAVAVCRGRGMELARVDSDAENTWIAAQVGANGRWLDANDKLVDGQWRTENSVALTFTGFTGTQPDGAATENCASVDASGAWEDVDCSLVRGAVCELQDPVTWTAAASVTATGDKLTRSAGNAWSAGAISSASIASGNGFVQFSTSETNTSKIAGLGKGNTNQSFADIDYGVYLTQWSTFEIWENNVNRGTFGYYSAGDVFRVEVLNGQVRYVRNGDPFYTSPVAPSYPLVFDTSLYHQGSTITDARIRTCAQGDANCITEGLWQNPAGVMVAGSMLTRTWGNAWSAGASTYATIASGDGYAQFTTGEVNTSKIAGLSSGDGNQSFAEIDYGVYLTQWGTFEVWENNADRGTFGSYLAGDVFRVEVLDGQIRYAKNGVPFYTSLVAPSYPLRLDTSLYHQGSTIRDAIVTTCAAGDASCIKPGMWKNPKAALADGGTLTRTLGKAWSGGASSYASIPLGATGYVQFTTAENTTSKIAGLGNGDTDAGFADVDYGIYLTQWGTVEVWENDAERGSFAYYVPGDVFRVEVLDGQVRYVKNGVPFYTSSVAPTSDLVLDVSLYHEKSTIKEADVVTCAPGDTGCVKRGDWKTPVGVLASGDSLTRTWGNAWSAGASSYATIDSGNGYVQFTTAETNKSKIAGLGSGDPNRGFADIDFGVYLTEWGTFEVWESNVSRGAFGYYAAGDVFRVEALDGQVLYKKNGIPFYTSTVAPTYPLVLDTSLYHQGATIKAASVAACDAGDLDCIPIGMWKNPTDVMAAGDTLTRTWGNAWSAGASSYAKIVSGDGYVQFTTSETNTSKIAGLGVGDPDQSFADVDHGIYLTQWATIEVWENNVNRGAFGYYAAGDLFRVEVLNGQVRYLKNGIPFYTSPVAPSYPLALDTSVYHQGATITGAKVVSCVSGDTACINPGFWKNPVAAWASGNTLSRTWGNAWTAGASSYGKLFSGDGYVQFTTGETNTSKIAGFGVGDPNQGFADVDYGIYLTQWGTIEIRENNVARGNFGTYVSTDLFRVEVKAGQVRYLKNGTVMYTSTIAPTYPLMLDTSLYHQGATIKDAAIGTAIQPGCATIFRGGAGNAWDTDLSPANGDWAAGGYTSLWTGGADANSIHAAAIKFDMSPVPVGATITSATLKVYVAWNSSSSTVRVHEMAVPWDESTATWGLVGGAAAYTTPVLATFDPVWGADGFRSVSLTSLAQAWLDGSTPNNGVVLEEGVAAAHAYNTSEGSNLSKRPSLTVCWSN